MNMNPMLMMQKMFGGNTSNMNPMAQMMRSMMNNNNGQLPQFDVNQFKNFLPQITDEQINNLAQQAKAQGMSETDINNGLNAIKRMRAT